jgi:hypothetical protein
MSYPSRLDLDYAFGSHELDERVIQGFVKKELLTPVLFCPLTPPDKNMYDMSPWYIHRWCKSKKLSAIKFTFYKYVLAVAIAVSYSNFLDIFERYIRDDTPILYDLVIEEKDIGRLRKVFTKERDTLWEPEIGSKTVTGVLEFIWMRLNGEEPGFSPSNTATTGKRRHYMSIDMDEASKFYISAISAVLALKEGLPAAISAVLAFKKGLPDHFMGPNAMLVTEDANSIFHRNETIPAFVNGLINKILIEHRRQKNQQEENEGYEIRLPPPKVPRMVEPHRGPPPPNSHLKIIRNATDRLARHQLASGRLAKEELALRRGPLYPSLRGNSGVYPPHGGKRTKRERKNRKRHTQRRK